MKDVFEANFRTSSLGSRRFVEEDLIKRKSNEGLTVTHVLMAAQALKLYPFESLFIGDKYDRMNFLEYLIQKYDASLLCDVDDTGMTAMHCASLLFQGNTPQRALTPQEIRSKRMKSYPSLELKLLDILVNSEVFFFNSLDLS